MSYEVIAADQRTTAGHYTTVATDTGAGPVDLTHVDADSVGHVELTTFLAAVDEQVTSGHADLVTAATELSGWLEDKATWYETADEQVYSVFGPQGDPFAPGPLVTPPWLAPSVPGAGS